jgi:hypothetical protein
MKYFCREDSYLNKKYHCNFNKGNIELHDIDKITGFEQMDFNLDSRKTLL